MRIANKKELKLFFIISLTALGLAQFGNYLVHVNLYIGESVEVLPFLHFTHVRNFGGIFGLLQGKGWFFGLFSILFLAGIVLFVCFYEGIRRSEYICYALIVGGGLSNVTDRLIYGSVIDFIDVRGIPFWHYIFNTADVTIHLGVWPLIFLNFFYSRKYDAPQPRKEPIG